MRQFQIKSHILSCFDCLNLKYCFTLANILEAARCDAERMLEDRDYELFSRQDDYYDDYYDSDDYYDYYDDYGADEYDPDEYDYQDEWDDIDYLAEAAECLNFEHYAPKSRIHTNKQIKKDKRFYLKKKCAHLPMRKRFRLHAPLISTKEVYQWIIVNAIEFPHQKGPLKTGEGD